MRVGLIAGAAVFLWFATVSVSGAVCVGDCDGNGAVTVNELVNGVAMALARQATPCRAMDMDSDGNIAISELIAAVAAALSGCSSSPTIPPTPTATPGPGFRICGMAAERPFGPPPSARAVYFTLHPVELITISNPAGVFCFDDIAPGNYTISVKEYQNAPTHCTRDGCWETESVSVVDVDVVNVVIEMRPLPTATPHHS